MENIKKIVSISAIIACTNINGGVCGDSCKVDDANAIEFENYTKLEGDTRKKVLKFITDDNEEYRVNEKETIESDCVVFASKTSFQNTIFYIFLFNEKIYKAQTDDKIKNAIKQLDNKQLYFIVGFEKTNNTHIDDTSAKGMFKSIDLTITKVDGNDNKYKLEIGGITNPVASGKAQMGTVIPSMSTSTTTTNNVPNNATSSK